MRVQDTCKFIAYRQVLELFCANIVTKESLFIQFTQKYIQIGEEAKEKGKKKSVFWEHDSLNSPLTD